MKSNKQAKTTEPEAKHDSPDVDRTIWFLGKELKEKPAEKPVVSEAKTKEKSKKAKAVEAQPEPAEEPAERRPTQLEAYMRYVKMREPNEDREDDGLAPIGARRFPSEARRAANDDDDMDWNDGAPRRHRPSRAGAGLSLRDAVLAGVASIAIGALAGAVVYDRTNDGELSAGVFDTIGQFLTGLNGGTDAIAAADTGDIVPENRSTPASFKKPVTTATLDVNDAKGDINTPIPLSIHAEPALPDQDIALRLSGLPADAYLTAGTKLPDNAWMLKPAELNGVKLMVPSAPASPLLIAVEAIEPRTGDLAAPTEEIKVALNTPAAAAPPPQIEPVSAPATDVKRNYNLPPASRPDNTAPQPDHAAAQPIPVPLENDATPSAADSATLMRNGDKLLGVGDFTAARAFFTRARELGNREASLRLGQTYDPVVFRDRNVQGLKPDPKLALKYYLEARTAGIDDADNAINGLESWLKQ